MLECCYGKKHEPARCLHKDIIDKYGGKILFLEYITSNDRPSADGAGWRTVILSILLPCYAPGSFHMDARFREPKLRPWEIGNWAATLGERYMEVQGINSY